MRASANGHAALRPADAFRRLYGPDEGYPEADPVREAEGVLLPGRMTPSIVAGVGLGRVVEGTMPCRLHEGRVQGTVVI